MFLSINAGFDKFEFNEIKIMASRKNSLLHSDNILKNDKTIQIK